MRAFKSKVLHAALMLLVSFVPLALVFEPIELYMLTGSVLFTTSFAVVHAYWPALRTTIDASGDKAERVDALAMAIVLIFLATGLRECYVTFYREFVNNTRWLPTDYYKPLVFIRYTAAVAAVMALVSMRVPRGETWLSRLPGWPRAASSVALGLVIGAILILNRS